MHWFTRECLTGQLSDEDWQERFDDYAEHLAKVAPMLGNGAQALHPEVTNLHGAQIQSWSCDDHRFQVRLLAGDLQQGYNWIVIAYDDATLLPFGVGADLDAWPLSACEVAADEITVTAEGVYEHRLLLWPQGEFAVQFSSCSVNRSSASKDDRRSLS